MTRLAKNHCLVMGASSPVGIGAAVARSLADEGAKVSISARREAALAEVARDLDVLHRPCDITDPASVDTFFTWLDDHLAPLHTAVYATGLNHFTPIDRFDADKAMPCIQTQLVGGLVFIREVARRMEQGGSIILLSSLTASRPAFGTAVYAGTKAAMDQVTRIAALEYANRGIRVNGVAPGMTRTEMTETMFDNPNFERAVLKEIPLGRMGEAGDVASAVRWLADPDCFMTGEVLSVTGGAELRRVPTLEEITG